MDGWRSNESSPSETDGVPHNTTINVLMNRIESNTLDATINSNARALLQIRNFELVGGSLEVSKTPQMRREKHAVISIFRESVEYYDFNLEFFPRLPITFPSLKNHVPCFRHRTWYVSKYNWKRIILRKSKYISRHRNQSGILTSLKNYSRLCLSL